MKEKAKKAMSKKTKWILWGSIGLGLVVVVVVSAFLLFGGGLSAAEANEIITEDVLTAFVPLKQNNNAFISKALDSVEIATVSVTNESENTVIAHCKVKTKDVYGTLKKALTFYGDKQVSVSELLEFYDKEIDGFGNVEYDVDVKLSKEEEAWVVEYSYDFLNALMGGYLQFGYEETSRLGEGE